MRQIASINPNPAGQRPAGRLPGVRIERAQAGRHPSCGLTAVTPLDAETIQANHAIWWTMPWRSALKPLIVRFTGRFLEQDRRVVAPRRGSLAQRPRLMLIDDAGSGQMVLPAQARIRGAQAREPAIRESDEPNRTVKNAVRPFFTSLRQKRGFRLASMKQALVVPDSCRHIRVPVTGW